MHRLALLAAFGGLELLKISLAQTEVVPGEVWQILGNFPELTIFLIALYYTVKWLERVYGNNQAIVSDLVKQTDESIKEVRDEVRSLKAEIQVLRGTVSEVAKVDDLMDRLMEKIWAKNKND